MTVFAIRLEVLRALLAEAYDALSKAHVELKTRVDELAGICTYIPELLENLQKHKHAVSGEAKTLKSDDAIDANRQICAGEAKNLGLVAETKTVTGDIERRHTFAVTRNIDLINKEARGLITEFMAYLEREGFADENSYPTTLSHLVKDGADLLDEFREQIDSDERLD